MEFKNGGIFMFFIQMSGFPGSGKSTLAKEISKITGAVIIDHDISKTALLESLQSVESNIDGKITGKISYDIDWALIDSYLSQGHKVIFDSPCLYSEIVDKGISLSEKYNIKYKYIECYVQDMDEVNYRLKKRQRMLSQIEQITSKESFNKAISSSKRPQDDNYLVIDSSKPLDSYIDHAIQYINA